MVKQRHCLSLLIATVKLFPQANYVCGFLQIKPVTTDQRVVQTIGLTGRAAGPIITAFQGNIWYISGHVGRNHRPHNYWLHVLTESTSPTLGSGLWFWSQTFEFKIHIYILGEIVLMGEFFR